jgi:vitamin B12 transporter
MRGRRPPPGPAHAVPGMSSMHAEETLPVRHHRHPVAAGAAAAALALLPAAPAAAQGRPEPVIQTVPDTIVTGTRIPTPEARVPASITVVTRREIEERGYQSLAEALIAVPGLRLAPTGGLGSQTSAFLRGTSSRSVLVLLDGVPINDPAEPNAAFNFNQDLLFDVERIEVLRGPASVLYGSGAG